jgi:hypothetical protein
LCIKLYQKRGVPPALFSHRGESLYTSPFRESREGKQGIRERAEGGPAACCLKEQGCAAGPKPEQPACENPAREESDSWLVLCSAGHVPRSRTDRFAGRGGAANIEWLTISAMTSWALPLRHEVQVNAHAINPDVNNWADHVRRKERSESYSKVVHREGNCSVRTAY